MNHSGGVLMEAGNRRKFSREFKIEAVRMSNEGIQSINGVARDLGIHASLLGRWRRQLAADSNHAFPGKGKLKEPDEENRRLRREVERLRTERDILKKPSVSFPKKTREVPHHRQPPGYLLSLIHISE